ncbi:hypothetical protein INT47_012040 [Mucor saturninus]|uniref:Small nuclear ribonucleoprotein Prp3 C-terminal domain-containing protein n=1 Tax=Mucor saturninus TaxID=64648 RepID=A0A8H7QPV0_9FUNG|nr:hypothetical protein INT47_012040 [Mucor saturninus]
MVDTQPLTDAVNTIDLLQSIYFDQEFEFDTETEATLYKTLQACWESDTWDELPPALPPTLQFTIKAPVELPEEEDILFHLIFQGRISLMNIKDYQLSLPASSNGGWLSRQQHQALLEPFLAMQAEKNNEEEERSTQIIERMQHLQDLAVPLARHYVNEKKAQAVTANLANADNGPLRFLREWIWFPMIYTREKRGDIIDWAPKYGITGVLVPGKPGMMCLEGTEKKVVQFINDIKTISWASIPAGHRKMSSRWKQVVECDNMARLNEQRLFQDMAELKFDIHGPFGNRNSLSLLQAWMQEKGCGEAFDHLFEYDSAP